METPARTTKQELASVLLGEDVMQYIHRRRRAGETWDVIRDDLATDTGGRVNITLRSIHAWNVAERELTNA